jgi:hypothetical protein
MSKKSGSSDAIKSLISLGYKPKEAIALVQNVIDKHGNNLSAEEYTKLAMQKPKPTTNVDDSPSKVPDPAGEEPEPAKVSAPVSKPAGEPLEPAKISAPASNVGGSTEAPAGNTPLPKKKSIKIPTDNEIADIKGYTFVNKNGYPVIHTKGKNKGKELKAGQESSEQKEKILANPSLLAKYKKVSELEEIINPFQRDNFL